MGHYVQGRRKAGAVVVLTVVTVACWAAWLGWDLDAGVDADRLLGPYGWWQVVGCGLCLLVVAGAAGRWLPSAEIAWTVTFAFTLAFATGALLLPGRQPGMALGTIPVFFATFAGTAAVACAAEVFWTRHLHSPDDPATCFKGRR
ncbi:hypothetical protein [Actinomycetospora soli]|uniref:hypothetical protein n=1 Tax=Actinomycetospora soli TaxID=2893887 RepID=UPI001E569184|nr:hypothetical protein [Actinomycetospora soli]MCD2190964.1 hypothetical protein [Actinomycetospora soli]